MICEVRLVECNGTAGGGGGGAAVTCDSAEHKIARLQSERDQYKALAEHNDRGWTRAAELHAEAMALADRRLAEAAELRARLQGAENSAADCSDFIEAAETRAWKAECERTADRVLRDNAEKARGEMQGQLDCARATVTGLYADLRRWREKTSQAENDQQEAKAQLRDVREKWLECERQLRLRCQGAEERAVKAEAAANRMAKLWDYQSQATERAAAAEKARGEMQAKLTEAVREASELRTTLGGLQTRAERAERERDDAFCKWARTESDLLDARRYLEAECRRLNTALRDLSEARDLAHKGELLHKDVTTLAADITAGTPHKAAYEKFARKALARQ